MLPKRMKIVPVRDLRRDALKQLRDENDVVYITQHGRPAAVLIDIDQF